MGIKTTTIVTTWLAAGAVACAGGTPENHETTDTAQPPGTDPGSTNPTGTIPFTPTGDTGWTGTTTTTGTSPGTYYSPGTAHTAETADTGSIGTPVATGTTTTTTGTTGT